MRSAYLPKHLRGLRFKVLLFLLIASVPALFVVELGLLSMEYWEASQALKKGAAQQQVERIAGVLANVLQQQARQPDSISAANVQEHLRLQLENERLWLMDPSNKWLIEDSYVLQELSAGPIRLSVRKPDGSLWIAASNAASNSQLQDAQIWLANAEVPGQYLGQKLSIKLEIALSPPWRKIIRVLTFEWPVIFAILVLLGTAIAIFLQRVVLKRLERIAEAAEGWSQERFAVTLTDHSADEIGVLTRRLNVVAAALSQRMEERAKLAILEERQRLARDLHDSVKQHGFALELQLGAIAAGFQRANTHIGEGTRIALEEAQTLSKQLRLELDVVLAQLRATQEQSLAHALAKRCADFTRRSQIQTQLQGELQARIADSQIDTVLKIFDEALANVWRHAKASKVQIELSQEPQRAWLKITDDGVGFDSKLSFAGMGLSNMQLRATTLPGYQFRIDSTPQGGTSVELSWVV